MLRHPLSSLKYLCAVALVGIAAMIITSSATHALPGAAAQPTVASTTSDHGQELTAVKAAILGVVEGITEFLPISSSGHLLIAERLMNIGDTPETAKAADTYTIVIQAGAILAVLVISWRRVLDVLKGIIGKSPEGRRLFVALVLSFLPAAAIGIAGESGIKKHLLEPIPVSIAWIAGALAILIVGAKLHERGKSIGRTIADITPRDAVIIGFAQALALWPGTSRSLVTILGALALGISLSAAVEYSFLLGLMTLGAATAKDVVSDGQHLIDTYGTTNPMIGFVVAFVSAVIAVRWMVGYLQQHDLKVFAWYRLAAATAAIALVAAGTI